MDQHDLNSIGKDEVGSSNLPSSSKNTRFSGVFSTFSGLFRGVFDCGFSFGNTWEHPVSLLRFRLLPEALFFSASQTT